MQASAGAASRQSNGGQLPTDAQQGWPHPAAPGAAQLSSQPSQLSLSPQEQHSQQQRVLPGQVQHEACAAGSSRQARQFLPELLGVPVAASPPHTQQQQKQRQDTAGSQQSIRSVEQLAASIQLLEQQSSLQQEQQQRSSTQQQHAWELAQLSDVLQLLCAMQAAGCIQPLEQLLQHTQLLRQTLSQRRQCQRKQQQQQVDFLNEMLLLCSVHQMLRLLNPQQAALLDRLTSSLLQQENAPTLSGCQDNMLQSLICQLTPSSTPATPQDCQHEHAALRAVREHLLLLSRLAL